MVQEAEELKSVPALVLPSKDEVEAFNVSHLPFRSWCSAWVRGRGSSLGHHKSTRRRRRQSRCLPSPWIKGFLGILRIEHTIRCQCSSCGIALVKGIWSHPVPSKGVVHTYPARALMDDLDFMEYKQIIFKSGQEPSIVALCDAVRNGWHGEIVPEASPKGERKGNELSLPFSLCTDLRGPSKTSWSRNLELRWSPGVRCWLGWSSVVPTFSYFSTRVSRTTVTQQALES